MSFEPFAELRDVPVNVTGLHTSASSALAVDRADIVLGVDRGNGLIRNVVFDEARLSYDEDYENSQFFSPAFRAHNDALAQRLIQRYDLAGGHVVEIGSGKGEFLTELCNRAGARGFGFDPSYSGQSDEAAGGRVKFVVDTYDERYLDQPVDLLCCRHVLEHLDDPHALLASLRRTLDRRPDTVLYFEVPNALDVLSGGGMWDIIYQHVWYFAPSALRWLFESHGFEVLDLGTSFGDSFLWIEARPGRPSPAATGDEARAVADAAAGFADRLGEHRGAWGRWLAGSRDRDVGAGVALWGAGAKGVTFLNVVDTDRVIDSVIDVNPRKQGSYVPGTGQEIVGPEALPAGTEHVLVMNPMYVDEVATMLASTGVAAAVVPVHRVPRSG